MAKVGNLLDEIQKKKKQALSNLSHTRHSNTPDQLVDLEISKYRSTKPVSKSLPVACKPVAKPVPISLPVAIEPVAVSIPVYCQPVIESLPVLTEPVAEPVVVQNGTGTEPVAEPVAILNVVQLQKKVLFYIYNRCRQIGSLTSPLITKEELREACKTTTGAAKQAILKLEKKGFLKKVSFRNGVSGGVVFQIPNRVFQAVTLFQTGTEPVAFAIKPVAEPVAEPVAPLSSSSSSLRSLNKAELLTTGVMFPKDQAELDSSWQKIDFSPLTEIRFGRHQVAQIAREGKFTPEELQDSIYAFAFDLSENDKAKTITGVPLNYFMGILRRGPYAAPSNYESPDVLQKRLYLESKEKQLKKRQELEVRLEAVEFEEWLEKLSLEQRAAVVPPKDFAKPGGTAHNYQMREYFRDNVWPALKEKTNEI